MYTLCILQSTLVHCGWFLVQLSMLPLWSLLQVRKHIALGTMVLPSGYNGPTLLSAPCLKYIPYLAMRVCGRVGSGALGGPCGRVVRMSISFLWVARARASSNRSSINIGMPVGTRWSCVFKSCCQGPVLPSQLYHQSFPNV